MHQPTKTKSWAAFQQWPDKPETYHAASLWGVRDENGHRIAIDIPKQEALLICAAPALLEACKAAIQMNMCSDAREVLEDAVKLAEEA